MTNKVWRVFSMGVLPVILFLSPIFFAEYFDKNYLYWLFTVSWIPSVVLLTVVGATQLMPNDEQIMEKEYNRLKSQEQNETTP
jgi:hypothetical protein